jgi:dTDP-4-amino-4,6-dideoxygalactose transaminase
MYIASGGKRRDSWAGVAIYRAAKKAISYQVMERRFGGKEGDCPITEDISDRLLRLPFYNNLSEEDQDRIISVIEAYQ